MRGTGLNFRWTWQHVQSCGVDLSVHVATCALVCGKVLYLCTVAALRVVVVLGGQLAVCVFIRGYTVVVVLVIIKAQIQCV